MPMQKAIIHVGMHKTGTSSIQVSCTLEENFQFLKSRGLYYPFELGFNHSIAFYNLFSLSDPMYYVHNIQDSVRNVTFTKKNNFATLHGLVSGNTEETLLISGEDIALLSLEEIQAMHDFFVKRLHIEDFQILLYTRNPVAYYISLTQSLVRTGRTLDLFSLEKHYYAYRFFQDTISKFQAVFGRDAVCICKFEDALSQFGCPVKHFLAQLGLSDLMEKFTIKRWNVSLGQEIIDFFAFFNEKVPLLKRTCGVDSFNEERNEYKFDPLLRIPGTRYDFPLTYKKVLATKVMRDTRWLKDHTGIDYIPAVQAVIDSEGPEMREPNPAVWAAMEKAVPELNEKSAALVQEYLQTRTKYGL